jgi:hypothetical protein
MFQLVAVELDFKYDSNCLLTILAKIVEAESNSHFVKEGST